MAQVKQDNESAIALLNPYFQSYELSCDGEPCPEKSNLEEYSDTYKWRWWTSKSFHLAWKLIVACLALWGSIDIFYRSWNTLPNWTSKKNSACWCGNSDAEAVAMGCRYDHLAVDWLPLYCIDEELTAEFDRSGPGPLGAWDYFTNVRGTEKLNESQIDEYAVLGRTYFTTREWHIAHCVFTWRKQFRARSTSKIVEPWSESEDHIMHCGNYFMSGLNLSDIDIIIPGANRHKRVESVD